jgi:hypothetical protein
MKAFQYITVILPLLLAACGGYSFGEGNNSVLAPEYRTLAISGVSNPTTLSWLEPRIRKVLRDELTNRGSILWVDDQGKADATIFITINRYNRPTVVSGSSDQTLRSVASFQFQAVIRSTIDDSVLWESGSISQDWPFYTGGEEEADLEVTRLGVRRLADLMSENY